MRSAIASATDDLPDAVGPKIARTVSAKEAAADARERLAGRAAGAQILLRRAVQPLDLADGVVDRLGRRHGDVDPALALLLVARLVDPGADQRGKVPPAGDVVLDDRVVRHADESLNQCGDEAGAVLARRAVDDDGAAVRI